MPHCNLYQQVKMEQYKTQSDCNDAVECDLICQCVAKDLVESHTFEGWYVAVRDAHLAIQSIS